MSFSNQTFAKFIVKCFVQNSMAHKHSQGSVIVLSVRAILYTAKHSRGKTFAFIVENGYSLENFCGSMLIDLYCQSTRS